MSKYTRSLPIPIITLLNKNRELIYDKRFANIAIAGHALCVSKAKRTALACAHSEAQASKRRTVGFYKDPVLSADDISYGLLAFYYLNDSHAAIEQFMDAFDSFLDTVPELADGSASVNERVSVSEREAPVSASVESSVSASVNERERESAKTTSVTSTSKKTSKRKSNDKATLAESERKALAKVIARTHKSKSVQRNPKVSIPRVNKEAHEANAYLRNIKTVEARSKVIMDAISDDMMHDVETQKRGATFDETAEQTQQLVVNHTALDAFMALTTSERVTLMQVIYQKHVKGQTQDETTNTDSTTQNA